MTPDDTNAGSFAKFKNSFYYGARNDLNFKFLKVLTEAESAQFFQELLWKLGDSYDDGDLNRLIQHAYQWQLSAYTGESSWTYEDGPFTRLAKPLSQSRRMLLSSSGHFIDGEDPQPLGAANMTQAEAAARVNEFLRTPPQLTAIPINTPQEKLRVRHPGYDIRGAQADANVVFPYERMLDLDREGVFGQMAPNAYTFVGAAAQNPLIKKTGPQWVKQFQEQQIDAALLVPV